MVQNNVLETPPGSMLVYKDIVTDTVIGDVTASLLAVLPLHAEQAQAKFTPTQLAYHRVTVRNSGIF